MPEPKPPKFPPREPEDDLVPGVPRRRPGTEVYEIEIDDPPQAVSKRQTIPVPPPDDELPGPTPANNVPTRPSGGGIGQQTRETARPPRALGRHITRDGLGFDPQPSLGDDTDFDPREDRLVNPLRQTTAFERSPPRADADALDLSIGDRPTPTFDVPDNEALDLVSRFDEGASAPPAEPAHRGDALGELRERYALGDFSGALTIAEALLEEAPDNADAQRYAESCRDVLKQMYAARLGPLDQVPVVAIPAEQLRWLTLDHRSGFLLSHVDGVSTLEDILDISGMPHLEAMRIIYELVQQKVIALQ